MPQITNAAESGKCPHCLTAFSVVWQTVGLPRDDLSGWMLRHCRCPACGQPIFILRRRVADHHGGLVEVDIQAWPKDPARAKLPADVPQNLREDFREACLILNDSPKASAALSRRCLQQILRDNAGVKPGDLFDEIQQVLDSKTLPTYLAEPLDAVRHIGNFAAHPIKSKNTGEVIEVEPGEAEWLLDILEGLFDFYFVQPEKFKRNKEGLNEKLIAAGKKPML